MIAPNIATDMPATIIVVVPVPSQTMMSGAKADFGKLFKITRYGSNIFESVGECHSMVANSILNTNTHKKLTIVSNNVINICIIN